MEFIGNIYNCRICHSHVAGNFIEHAPAMGHQVNLFLEK
jgi:hypothetical protein